MIRYSNRATKDLSKLPAGLRQKAESVLQQLDSNPIIGTKLKGKLQGLRSARLGQSHRILYRIEGSDVVVLTVQPRRDAYR